MTGSSSKASPAPASSKRTSARTSPARRSPARSPGTRLAAASPKPAPKLEKTVSSVAEDPKGFLDSILQSDGIQALAQMSGLPEAQVLGGLCFTVVAMIFGFGANLACSVVGFVYPMYKSFQAIEMTGLGVHEVEGGATEENLARCVNLLKYWVVYTFFTVIELFSDVLLSWVPFYYPLKLALLVWCLKYDGAQSLYTSTFGKLLKQYEPQITQATERFSEHASTFVTDVKEGGRKMARQHSASIVSGTMGAMAKLTTAAAAEPEAAPTKSE